MKINFQQASFLTSCFDTRKITLPKRPEIVFVGRSNVGKSSMINKLLNRKSIARVSGTPGKTIAVNYFDIDGKIYFVDVPGYGYASRSESERVSWGKLINSYFSSDRDIRLIVMLVDIRHEPTKDDMEMFNFLMSGQRLFCVVATKADKLSKTELKNNTAHLSEIFGTDVIAFSSQTGLGAEQILQITEDVSDELKIES